MYDKLNDNELFEVYQQAKHNFIKAIIGSQEENNLNDKLILICKEMDNRKFDLKKYNKNI